MGENKAQKVIFHIDPEPMRGKSRTGEGGDQKTGKSRRTSSKKSSKNGKSKKHKKRSRKYKQKRPMKRMPGGHETSPGQLPGIFVPHYEDNCICFSCRWVRKTKYSFILSKTQLARSPYPVVNPTHGRVPQDERQRLLTPVTKNRFHIMYIYSMKLGEGRWGWVVVLPLPLLPFLLTDDRYSSVSRVARHPEHGWFGLKGNGQRLDIGHEMLPPIYNPLYQYYGYHPQCSPYRLYVPPHEEEVSDNNDNLSPGDDINPPTQKPTKPSSRNSNNPSTHKMTTFPALNSTVNSSPDGQAAPPPMDQFTSAFDKLAKVSAGAQATSSRPSADQSTSDNDKWLENPEWTVVDTRCANPPEPLGRGNQKCQDPSHNGKYYVQHCDKRYTDCGNTTIFVGGLKHAMTKEELHYWFQGFGELMHVRKWVGQTSGFVQYPGRTEAEMAMSQMQGFSVHGARLRLSWGNAEKRMDPEYWNYYKQSAWAAHRGWQDFKARMDRGESRREDDPEFWQS